MHFIMSATSAQMCMSHLSLDMAFLQFKPNVGSFGLNEQVYLKSIWMFIFLGNLVKVPE